MFQRKTVIISVVTLAAIIIGLFLITAGKAIPGVKNDSEDSLSAAGGETNNPLKKESDYNNDSSFSGTVGEEEVVNKNLNDSNNTMTDFDKTKSYTASMKTTAGDIVISLNASTTPITVKNFITLAEKKFYDNVIFHRVIKGFMIQGGDPTGTGTGGPGYKFDDEPFTGEYTRGTVAMANSGPNTNGSQFFIMHADNPLPKLYVIFGKVLSGLDTVDKIAAAPTGPGDRPTNPVKIISVDIKVE